MKKFIVLSTICLLTGRILANDSTIIFRPVSYTNLFDICQKEQKPAFLYFHFDGCSACVQMEKTAFANPEVANFYNEHFVCLEVNTRKGEGIETNKIYNVLLHPTFIYVDENGRIMHKLVGIYPPEEFLRQAEQIIGQTRTLAKYKARYAEGEREAEFLREYCYMLRDAHELDSLVVNEYLHTQSTEDLSLEKNIRFIYEFAVHNFEITIPFGSKAFDFLLNNREQFYNYFDPEQVDTRIVWVVNRAIYHAIDRLDDSLFNQTTEVIRDFDNGKRYTFKEMDGRPTGIIVSKNLVATSKMAYYERAGDVVNYQEALAEYIQKIWDDAESLNSIAWDYYEKKDNKSDLEAAKRWSMRSIELNNNYNNNDTYAAILFKLGEYNAALIQAEKAIAMAKNGGLNDQETVNLLERIRQELNK